ncbi:VOC family protein [Bacillus sp. REN16]|uniref:VOC family protein n=1 Tax=Bacillus sp. REN16 TaxID=2887296 RepID=UPI001E2A7E91|nr:VOC family protein [Bacillus sp. REN16]MCC3357231.1 VOC family protein [Bacillus sp. REN16]
MKKIKQTPIQNTMGGIFIHVSDLKRSVEWYSNILGFEPDLNTVQSPVYNIPVTGTTSLTLDDHAFDPTFSHQPSRNPIFNFLVDDIDAAYDFIKSKDIDIVREIERVGDNFAWFNFKDPDGNVVMACTC